MQRPWTVRVLDDSTLERQIRGIESAVAIGLLDPSNHTRVHRMISNCRARDDACELNALWAAWRAHVKYVADIRGVDTFRAAHRTWQLAGGDCDDMTALVITDAKLIGFATAARVIAPNDPRHFEHIYPLVGLPKNVPTQWIALDLTVDEAYPGWEPPMWQRKAERTFVF